MKFILIVCVLVLASIASAQTSYQCSSNEGVIVVTTNDNDSSVIDFSNYSITDYDLRRAYYLLVESPNTNAINSKLIISEDLLSDFYHSQNSRFSSFKFQNDTQVFIANSSGSADFTHYKIKFKLNKKTLKAGLRFKSMVYFSTLTKVNDSLTCKKL